MNTIEPVFQSVGQALHVSHLMATLPVTQKVSTQILIDGLREQLGKTEARVSSTINLGGLTPLEFRGQCALVLAAVDHHLPPPEKAAIRARFAWDHVAHMEAIRYLADYLAPMTGLEDAWAVRGVVLNQYHRGRQRAHGRCSLRDIAQEREISMHALRKAQQVIRERGEALERRGECVLEELFKRTRLIEDWNVVASAA